MTTEQIREAARLCEHAFAFLIDEFGYQAQPARFDTGGFSLRYLGPVLGVEVDWYPRDPLTVWLVKLEDGAFPGRPTSAGPHAEIHRFDLGDVEAISNHERQVGPLQLYAVPDADNAKLLAGSTRTYAADLLRGDLSRVPLLERRVRGRARAIAIKRYGEQRAAQLGW